MGWLKNLGHSLNNTFNQVLPGVLAGTQLAGTALLGPQAGQLIGQGQAAIAGAAGHPSLSASNTGLSSILGSIFGGGVSVTSGDTQVHTGAAAVANSVGLANATGGINWLRVGFVALIVWIFWRMFGGKRRR